jgi:deazaflavin-dependent oxidoreductase (nitroreductase family)
MPTKRQVARFNTVFANHLFGPLLIRLPGFGAVHHRGRKSGRAYRTPVKVFRRGADYLITLPYGAGSDWVRNVIAAGGCELATRGRRVRLGAPTLCGEEQARAAIPAVLRRVLSWIRCTEFLALSPITTVAGRELSDV